MGSWEVLASIYLSEMIDVNIRNKEHWIYGCILIIRIIQQEGRGLEHIFPPVFHESKPTSTVCLQISPSVPLLVHSYSKA